MKISHKLIIPTGIFLLMIVGILIIILGAFKEQVFSLQGFYTDHITTQEQIVQLDRLFRESHAVIPELIVDNMMGEESERIAERATHSQLVLEQCITKLHTIAASSNNEKEKDLIEQMLADLDVYQTVFDEVSEICTTGDSYTASEKYPALKEVGNTIKEVFYMLISLESELVEDAFRTTADQAVARSKTVEKVIWIVSLMTLGFIGVMGFLITRWIILPLHKVVSIVNAMSKGDFSTNFAVDRYDEIGILAGDIIAMKTRIRDVLDETTGLIASVQKGQLDNRGNTEAFAGEWQNLIVGINTLVDAFVIPVMTTAMTIDRIAKGDVPEKITGDYQGDFNEIKENVNGLIDATQEVAQLAETMAKGNLTVDIHERSAQDTLMRSLQMMIQRLNQVVSDVKLAADNTAFGTQKMSAGAEEMSQSAIEQAATAEEVSASMKEMAANIRQNAENALQTEKIALQSAVDAQESGEAVVEAVAAMRAIARQIKMVEEIASQTHMLSLNATIEAAKAEEYGKGFAVIASEVRALAERSRLAAGQISELTSSGVTVAERAGKALTVLVPNIQHTADLVQGISAVSNEQSSGIEQINRALQQLNQIIQQNAVSSEEMAGTVEELASRADQLQQTIAFFTVDTTVRPMLTSDAGHRVRLVENYEHERVEVDRAIVEHARTVPDMGENGHDRDELDDEFERY
ncbi:hypothetical protein CSA56_01895 [candidate division KSB3 bacterium]|uniref:Chemotaxis protein n=1 Tax=candidate division KSB3 bacterium TaxID=2044937 RepID=A0A2G6KJY1_9BACT|nr:MAG: hypothetical protein CSA56_01895 [candidate division KSB3 bacterium]